uniref:Major sperm protein n=1 Tax=Acrobeloides nanus TaxID=290746 RepID=A0A914CH97_9BILA
MAASFPPSDIQMQPKEKIVFNSPFDVKQTYHIKITNSSAHRVGWRINTNMKRIFMDPPNGVLDPKETVKILVTCRAFNYVGSLPPGRISIEWTNMTVFAAKQFRQKWYECNYAMKGVKDLAIEFNP